MVNVSHKKAVTRRPALKHSNFKVGKNETVDTSGVKFSDEITAGYSQEEIELAKKLRAKNKDNKNITDDYCLQYARNMLTYQYRNQQLAIYQNSLDLGAIMDSDWAGYSYEEILQMESCGYYIPDEVLQWAYGQQSTDVTSYIVLADDVSADAAYLDTSAGESDINALLDTTKKYIAQSQNALEELKTKQEEYELKAQDIKNNKEEKEQRYKDSQTQMDSKKSDWQQLDAKKQQGETLSESEQMRYKELSNMLNSSDGTLFKQVQADAQELDAFLDSIDVMPIEAETNKELANKTIAMGTELSGLAQTTNKQSYDKKSLGMASNSLLSCMKFGFSKDDVAKLAIDVGTELDIASSAMTDEISSDIKVSNVEGAEQATETEPETKDETVEAAEGENLQPQAAENSETSSVSSYIVLPIISYINSIICAEVTAIASAETIQNTVDVDNAVREVKKDIKQSEKDTKEVTDKAEKANEEVNNNAKEKEELIQTIQTSAETDELTTVPENSDRETAVQQIDAINSKDEQETAQVDGLVDKNEENIKKYENKSDNLSKLNSNLTKRSQNLQEVSTITSFVGMGTMIKGGISTMTGTELVAAGAPLLSNPITAPEGVAMQALGYEQIQLGVKEHIFGAVAYTAGAMGLATTVSANQAIQNAKPVMKAYADAMKNEADADKAVIGEDVTTELTEETTETENAEETEVDETDSAQETDETQQEPVAETENEEENDNSEKDENQKNNKDSSVNMYMVAPVLSYINAGISAAITTAATAETLMNVNEVQNVVKEVQKEQKQSEKETQDITAKAEKANKDHDTREKRKDAIIENIKSAQDNASEDTSIVSEQENAEQELQRLDGEDKSVAEQINNEVGKNDKALKTYENNSANLAKLNSNLTKRAVNLGVVSELTTFVGVGTMAQGAVSTTTGTTLVAASAPLLSNPLTAAEGIAMQTLGYGYIQRGAKEGIFGALALESGVAGLATSIGAGVTSNNARKIGKEMEAAIKEETLADKNAQVKESQDKKEELKSNKVETADVEIVIEDSSISDNQQLIAGSAAANANTTADKDTDDKVDRKLTRFNSDSMIESKRRQRKVQAVFASARG